MPISKTKVTELQARMEALGLREEDLIEQFVLSSGPGGQNVQKSHTCVVLRHLPSGIEVKCQEERSRELNRYRARQRLCDKYQESLGQPTRRSQEAERIRRQKNRRRRRAKPIGPSLSHDS
jgi:peptide chain release factor